MIGTVQQVAGAAGIALLIAVYSAVSGDAAAAGASEVAANAAGAHAAFMIAAMVSLPLIVGAFFIRKPDDEQFATPPAH